MNLSLLRNTSLQQHIAEEISTKHFSIISSDTIKKSVGLYDALIYKDFQDSWNNLIMDNYMGDGGKYRERRYSVFKYNYDSKELIEKPGKPHYQDKAVNYLNGGIKRTFEPIEDKIKNNIFFVNLIKFCIKLFEDIKGRNNWHIESHQFRIISTSDMNGFPTPEGIHRDGVTYTFIMLIGKENITGGESHIYDNKRNHIISYMMENPFDCAFLDDTQLMHSVSPISCKLKGRQSYRDTLVITFKNL